MPALSRVRPVRAGDVLNETRFVPLVQEVHLVLSQDFSNLLLIRSYKASETLLLLKLLEYIAIPGVCSIKGDPNQLTPVH